MRYFELVDGKSSKFWQINNYSNEDKKRVETRYGRIGSDGIATDFFYDTLLEGSKIYEKKINDKRKKGYRERSHPRTVLTPDKPYNKKKSNKKKSNKNKNNTKKECPPGKMLNPVTGRCINIPKMKSTKKQSNKMKSTKKQSNKKKSNKKKSNKKKSNKNKSNKKKKNTKKECPPGKVLNTATGRCINIPKKKSSNKKKSNKKKSTKKKSIKKNKSLSNGKKVELPKSGICLSGADGKQVYDVGKNGVMLAHVFKDDKGKIKTAPKGFPQAPNGWWLSEKFDGYRAIWDGKDFRSRNNNIFETPRWFKDWLPAGISLDGELFLGRDSFEKCGLFRRKVPDNAEWRKFDVKYQIFDSPTCPGTFEERQKFITDLIKKKCECVKTGDKCPLVLTTQTKIKDELQVIKIYEELIKKGAEGVMLRAPGSPYDASRSSHLLKVKQHFDDEARIIGYKEGTGKYKGKLGAFKCELVKDTSIKFDTAGMNDIIRNNYETTHPIGTIITFVHMGFTKSGAPRHPNYLRIRLKE